MLAFLINRVILGEIRVDLFDFSFDLILLTFELEVCHHCLL
jgi:hypothetical protein